MHRDIALGGLIVPFVAPTRLGGLIVIDPRGWPPTEANWNRAKRLSALYKKQTGATAAYVVIPELAVTDAEHGVVNEGELMRILDRALEGPPALPFRKPTTRAALEPARGKPRIFAAMPFADDYDDVFMVAIASAAEKAGAVAERIDHQSFTGDIVIEIKRRIEHASAMVADLSELRPNVLYELGYADGLRLPAVRISSSPLKDLPFDIRNDRTIAYQKGQTHKLAGTLSRELKNLLAVKATRKRAPSAKRPSQSK